MEYPQSQLLRRACGEESALGSCDDEHREILRFTYVQQVGFDRYVPKRYAQAGSITAPLFNFISILQVRQGAVTPFCLAFLCL